MDEENDQQILDGIDEDIFKVNYEVGSFESLNYVLDKVENELSKFKANNFLQIISKIPFTTLIMSFAAFIICMMALCQYCKSNPSIIVLLYPMCTF